MYKQKAFTLIELLVVIAIIALLMAILMPALARVRHQAKTSACTAILKQWAVVFSMYTGDNDGYFNPGGSANSKTCRGLWFFMLEPYYRDGKLRLCPAAVRPRADGARDPFASWGPISEYVDDESADSSGEKDPWLKEHNIDDNYLSYGLNDWVRHDRQTEGFQKGREQENRLLLLWRHCNVRNAGNIPLFLDSSFFGSDPYHYDEPPEYNGDVVVGYNANEMKRFCLPRHGDGINAAFMDWSVKRVGLKQLWRLKWHREFNTAYYTNIVWPDWMRRLKDYD